ncbi:MAG: DNA alkylation repair protein [Phycisphaerae bacterium]|nr:DNA alkylation repair protein [Phycisphaerae bacterium]
MLASLRDLADEKTRAGMARYAIPSDRALGVPVGKIRDLAKSLKGRPRDEAARARNHALALELWQTGCYEARMLAPFLDDPASVTPQQMDAWAADFDNWAVCDHACFHLFDRLPDRERAFAKVAQWSKRREEFVKRAAFALLASLALHDKKAPDEPFLTALPLIERAANDDRNFVKKGVSWALRSIGRRNPTLRKPALELARRLSESADAAARWIGKDALRDLTRGK